MVDDRSIAESEEAVELQPFNPNDFEYEDLRASGVPAHIAAGIVRWRRYGKVYRIKEDVALVSGVTDSIYAVLKPYIVIADSLCQHDMDTSAIGDPVGLVSGINMIYFESDKRASEILISSAKALGLNASLGRIASGDKFIASKEEKKRIVDLFEASACEMEGCAIAQVAFVNNVPFAVVRAISDSADGEATMDYPTFLPIAAKNSASLTRALIKEW